MAKVLFVYSRDSSFIAIDREILRERFELRERAQRRPLVNPIAVARDVIRSDLVFGWFAYWHTFWPVTLAWLLRKPSVLVIGGFDTANMPDAGYGLQRGGLRRAISRWTMRRATRLITNSHFSAEEIERNTGIARDHVTVLHHGVPDLFGELPQAPRNQVALTVGVVDRPNLLRKGLRPFVEAATRLPDVHFVVAGKWEDDAADELRALAGSNVELTGWLSQQRLEDLYREASVYVQASLHEGFGLSVAEAMLAGCVPVTTRAGALPEVVGDIGVAVADADPGELAAAIERALAGDDDEPERARRHVLESFPLEARRDGILRVVEQALGDT
ncbi:MAG: glycosyltransferase [Solirubrobacterales bacterium]